MSHDAPLRECHSRCETYLRRTLSYNDRVRFLLDAMEARRCPIVPETFFQCVPCSTSSGSPLTSSSNEEDSSVNPETIRVTDSKQDAVRGGGYDPVGGKIVLCEDALPSQKYVDDTVTHELVHAYDSCRGFVNWSNCEHVACSEIRAANLSGDCKYDREFQRGHLGIHKQHQKCVKRRALLSLMMHPECSKNGEKKNELLIEKAFRICFADWSPFQTMS